MTNNNNIIIVDYVLYLAGFLEKKLFYDDGMKPPVTSSGFLEQSA